MAPPRSRWARVLFFCLGIFFVALAILGVVLPVLPTTPFLLLAAPCFARSSPRLYRWLLSNRIFGALIREWEATRTVPFRAKVIAISMIGVVGGTSCVFFVQPDWLKIVVGLCLLAIVLWLSRLPSR